MSQICYLMVGLPGSGKSTLCQNLLNENPELEIVSTDEFIEQYAKEKNMTYGKAMRELGDKPQALMNNKIQKLLKDKKSFIWDQTNVFISARKKKIKMLSQNKYTVIAIVTELSFEELNRRLDKRVSEGGKRINIKIINDMVEGYTRPLYNEGFSEIYLISDDNQFKLLEKNEQKLGVKI